MKYLFLLAIFVQSASANLVQKINLLLPALEAVESANDPLAIGDHGRAVGLLQHHEAYRTDVNKVYGARYTKADSFKTESAREITFFYLLFYGSQYEKVTGRPVSIEVLARIHNGGPTGYLKRSTIKYWRKVKDVL